MVVLPFALLAGWISWVWDLGIVVSLGIGWICGTAAVRFFR